MPSLQTRYNDVSYARFTVLDTRRSGGWCELNSVTVRESKVSQLRRGAGGRQMPKVSYRRVLSCLLFPGESWSGSGSALRRFISGCANARSSE